MYSASQLTLLYFLLDVSKSVPFDFQHESEIRQYLILTCGRLDGIDFTDLADKNIWVEYKEYGYGEILPPPIAFNHDFDEYGTYDYDVYDKIKCLEHKNYFQTHYTSCFIYYDYNYKKFMEVLQ